MQSSVGVAAIDDVSGDWAAIQAELQNASACHRAMSVADSGGAGQTSRPIGRTIIVTGGISWAVTSNCGGRKPGGSQARRRTGRDGSRATTACSIAPTRAPDGSRSPHSGDHHELADLEQDHVGRRPAAFLDYEELDLAVAGRPHAASNRFRAIACLT